MSTVKALDFGLISLVDELRNALNQTKADFGGEVSVPESEEKAIEKMNLMVDEALKRYFKNISYRHYC